MDLTGDVDDFTVDLNDYQRLLDKWYRRGELTPRELRIFERAADGWIRLYRRTGQVLLASRTEKRKAQVVKECQAVWSGQAPKVRYASSASERRQRLEDGLT